MKLNLRLLTAAFTSLFASSILAQVEWLSWGDETFALAAETQKPLYLSVGDPLHELTGSMHAQTFSNAEIAEILNNNFVCVRVGRDAAPGLAAFGQQWLATEQKLPGWPLNLWLTPDQLPIEAASYLPPTEEWGREGFMVVVNRVIEQWNANPDSVARNATRTLDDIAEYLPLPAAPVDNLTAALQLATEDWMALANSTHGVFGEPPHNLQPELFRFLIKRGGEARELALAALKTRITSPVRDPIDGGFYRGTVDATGGIPLFQKRLTDQARIALACLDAAAVSDDPIFAAGATSALDYALAFLSPGDGTFYIGDDATGETLTKHQTWSYDELVDLIGRKAADQFGATKTGNVNAEEDLEGHHAGRNILRASPLDTGNPSSFNLRMKVRFARIDRAETVDPTIATAAAHGLILHALDRATTELNNLDFGSAVVATRAALQRDFGVGTDFFSRTFRSDVPATPEDYFLVALGMNRPELAAAADELFYDDEFVLYFATTTETFGTRPYWWNPTATELPAPAIWRLFLPDAPADLALEVAAPFENPDVPPPGSVLLGLSQTLTP
jgi:uncharacterized protein YyaL (SSP411 family)